MNVFTLGCDPEIFLTDAAGALMSAIDKVGGSKDFPRPLPDLGEGFNVQEDNVAIEFGIPPAGKKEHFVANVHLIREYLRKQLKEYLKADLSEISAGIFPKKELDHPMAKVFGCDPDFNAWTMMQNPRPKAKNKGLRSAGGHIHVGYKFEDDKAAASFIKYMDLMASVPAVIMDKGILRKELYGKAGAYRIKPYGVEYRSLSNFWIFKDSLVEWAWAVTEQALERWQANAHPIDEIGEEVVQCINTNNQDTAQKLVNQYGLILA